MTRTAIGGSTTAGSQWGWLVDEATGLLLPGADPWAEYGIARQNGMLTALAPAGPAIYAVRGTTDWQYVGKTTRSVGSRLLEHGRSDPKLTKVLQWSSVVMLPLRPEVSARDLSRLEKLGHGYLRPRGGSAWG